MRSYADAGDYDIPENENLLNTEIDALLADDSKWRTPDWKKLRRKHRLLGIIIGAIIGIFIGIPIGLAIVKLLGY